MDRKKEENQENWYHRSHRKSVCVCVCVSVRVCVFGDVVYRASFFPFFKN